MKYIVFIILTLSFPAFAVTGNTSEYKKDQTKIEVLQKKIQKKTNQEGMCNPQKTSRLPTFN